MEKTNEKSSSIITDARITFNVLTEYLSVAGYDPSADYNIKKVTVTDVRLLSSPDTGTVDDIRIMEQYSIYG